MPMNAIEPYRAHPTEPTAHRLTVAAYLRMIAAGIFAEDDHVQVAELWA